ncbi:hypothetical protein [Pseudonocardia abyssalis]|uniref:Uncharacterized protein n=1 Tax=Pseudonocardia abyssalis TaxID=2792008 RepID=A0ABS6USP8_9PSEU|nr:hypothetical protein [Pseudonocardia abyssalis]MBW0117227.1 hypothetical protein [Pseudonocardia abyssalis]MBW0135278.1 hypothetical protein [Pseudonocardia abyssalis]
MSSHASGECAGCGWESHALAFRWFPELGPPLVPARDEGSHPPAVREAGAD